jgi:3-oxoacyl-[acyl-carrier-protein] synthase II
MAQSKQCATDNAPCAYRPFDKRACGLLLAEGAGICVVEEREHALKRGAPIYGEIVGYGQSNDAHGSMNPTSKGEQYARAFHSALREGQFCPREIGYISLDGRALPTSDQGEAEALHLVFGYDLSRVALSVPRTMLGHSYAAAGTLDTITALLALQHKRVPPTINCEQPDPRYNLALCQQPQPFTGTGMLVAGRSSGGANVVLALRATEIERRAHRGSTPEAPLNTV